MPKCFGISSIFRINHSTGCVKTVKKQIMFSDIVDGVRNGEIPPVRPFLPTTGNFDVKLIEMIRECWNEDLGLRPSFSTIKSRYFGLYKGR